MTLTRRGVTKANDNLLSAFRFALFKNPKPVHGKIRLLPGPVGQAVLPERVI
jgi:hypothetical protein